MSTPTPYDFQTIGADFMGKREGSLLADEAGTGKSIQTCLLINQYRPRTTLIVCPAFLTLNWEREVKKWCPDQPVRVVSGDDKSIGRDVLGVTIISYELSRLMVAWYSQFVFDLIVWDESHYLQNQGSLRSKAARMLKSRKRVCLSGTPIRSRTINLWHQLHLLNPVRWNDYWDFALRYCNAHKESYGWDVSGSSNLEELNGYLRKEIMLRRTKAEVLPQLPEKIRHIIEIPCASYRDLLLKEKNFYREYMNERGVEWNPVKPLNPLYDTFGVQYSDELSHMAGNNLYNMKQIATIRKKTGELKVAPIVQHIKNLLHEENKIVLFAHHHDTIDQYREHFPEALWADGRVKDELRDGICHKFQHDPSRRLLIAGIQALGVGVTLTEANMAVIAELDWTPDVVLQAEDRIHRIGLKHAVSIQHLVLQGSLDLDIANTLVTKQTIINQVIK